MEQRTGAKIEPKPIMKYRSAFIGLFCLIGCVIGGEPTLKVVNPKFVLGRAEFLDDPFRMGQDRCLRGVLYVTYRWEGNPIGRYALFNKTNDMIWEGAQFVSKLPDAQMRDAERIYIAADPELGSEPLTLRFATTPDGKPRRRFWFANKDGSLCMMSTNRFECTNWVDVAVLHLNK